METGSRPGCAEAASSARLGRIIPIMEARQASYRQNIVELEQIVRKIQSDDVDLDVLATEVERAKGLINDCRKRLRTTNEAVKRILEGIGDPPHNGGRPKDTGMEERMLDLVARDGECPPEEPEHETLDHHQHGVYRPDQEGEFGGPVRLDNE
jgi:exodeoxyribonuclease VII small subunit